MAVKQHPIHTDYFISDTGQVFKEEVEVPVRLHEDGYFRVVLKTPTGQRMFGLHRVMLETFVRLPEEGEIGRHLNDNKLDNRLENLAWGSYQDNADDRKRNGKQGDNRGDRNPMATLSSWDVWRLRRRYPPPHRRGLYLGLADEYGVTPESISNLLNYRTWGTLAYYESTKVLEHFASTAFRQWRAEDSHCSLVHGYGISAKFTFAAVMLDQRNWVISFGDLKEVKQRLEAVFDHKLVVAEDDPHLSAFQHLHNIGVADLVTLPAVGCEAFAKAVFDLTRDWLEEKGHLPRVRLVSVEIMEHSANSAIYREEVV